MVETRGTAGGRRISWTRLHRSGVDPLRVLLVGDRPVVHRDDEEGSRLADRIADRITGGTGRGLDLDVVWDLAPTLQAVESATEAWRLWRYEVVVVVVEDARLHDAWWRGPRVSRLARRVVPELAEASGVLVVRLRSTTDATGAAAWSHLGRAGTSVTSMVVPITADGHVPDVPQCADEIAEQVALLLDAAGDHAASGRRRTAGARRAEPEAEADRQRAVDRATDALGGVTPDLERVVLLARNTFEVPFAQVNLLDHGRVRTLAFAGMPGDAESDQPLCTITVQGSGPTIIADTWQDRRLDGNPHVHGAEHPVRFYAAHPIESADGFRIGTLCVFDVAPHDPDDIDPSVLRDLALLAEAEISTLSID